MTAEAALALVMTAGDIRTVLALPLSKAKPLSRLDSLGESNIILSGCIMGLFPGVAPVDLVEHVLCVGSVRGIRGEGSGGERGGGVGRGWEDVELLPECATSTRLTW